MNCHWKTFFSIPSKNLDLKRNVAVEYFEESTYNCSSEPTANQNTNTALALLQSGPKAAQNNITYNCHALRTKQNTFVVCRALASSKNRIVKGILLKTTQNMTCATGKHLARNFIGYSIINGTLVRIQTPPTPTQQRS